MIYQSTHKPNTIEFVKMVPEAVIPKVSRSGDIGYDVCSAEAISLPPGKTTKVSSGIQLAWQPTFSSTGQRFFMKVEGRSGLSTKGIFPVGGIIDPTYRGEIGIVLANLSDREYKIAQGDRIAQLVVYLVNTSHNLNMVEAEAITQNTERGEHGFGSSGV